MKPRLLLEELLTRGTDSEMLLGLLAFCGAEHAINMGGHKILVKPRSS